MGRVIRKTAQPLCVEKAKTADETKRVSALDAIELGYCEEVVDDTQAPSVRALKVAIPANNMNSVGVAVFGPLLCFAALKPEVVNVMKAEQWYVLKIHSDQVIDSSGNVFPNSTDMRVYFKFAHKLAAGDDFRLTLIDTTMYVAFKYKDEESSIYSTYITSASTSVSESFDDRTANKIGITQLVTTAVVD